MARILDAKCRLCRREGRKLFLKASRCYSKCPIDRKGAIPPGQHGQKRRSKLSDFGKQLREKQKVKRIYWLTERQIKGVFIKARKITSSKKLKEKIGAGEYLLKILENRLDNVVFRAGFAPSRLVARQVISHGHVQVDGEKMSISSYQLKKDQVITLSDSGMSIPLLKLTLEKKINPPAWIEKKGGAVKILRLPERKEIEADIDEQLIVEFYSR